MCFAVFCSDYRCLYWLAVTCCIAEGPEVKCGYADFKYVKCGCCCAADENPLLPTHANLSLFFPDSNWYISIVLLYVIAACVRSNKRYYNPLAYWIFAYSCTYYFILQGKVCNCDVSAVDCSVGLGMRWVRQSDFCGFWYSGSHSKWLDHTEPVLNAK